MVVATNEMRGGSLCIINIIGRHHICIDYTERKTKYNKRRRLQQISNGKEQDAYARAFESGTTLGAMRSAALARCHITAEHNVLSYRYTYPEPSVFLARTSFPPPSPHIVHSLPIFILHAVFLSSSSLPVSPAHNSAAARTR